MSSNIGGSGGRGRNALSSVDFYRRVPRDLTEVRERKTKQTTKTNNNNLNKQPHTHKTRPFIHTHTLTHTNDPIHT